MKKDRSKRFIWNSNDITIVPNKNKEKVTKSRIKIKKQLSYVIKKLEQTLLKVEKEERLQKVLKEIPQNTLNLFPVQGQKIYKDIYSANRLAGNSKEMSSDFTTKVLMRSFKVNQKTLIRSIEKELRKINTRLNS